MRPRHRQGLKTAGVQGDENFGATLLGGIHDQRLAALRALRVGRDGNFLTSVRKTAADFIFADAKLRFHRGATIIPTNGIEVRKIFRCAEPSFRCLPLIIERMEANELQESDKERD